MPKKRGSKKKNQKLYYIQSSSLCPAKIPGELIMSLPLQSVIKPEPAAEVSPENSLKTDREDAELDDLSNASVETQPLDIDDEAERQTSENVTIKTEPLDDYDCSNTDQSTINNLHQALQVPSDLRVSIIKTEFPENSVIGSFSPKLLNEKGTRKRKKEIEESLEIIKKAMIVKMPVKSEPLEPNFTSCKGDDNQKNDVISKRLEELKAANINKTLYCIKPEPLEPKPESLELSSLCNGDNVSQEIEATSDEIQSTSIHCSKEATVYISCPSNWGTDFSTELLDFAHLNETFDKTDLEEALENLSRFKISDKFKIFGENRTKVLNDNSDLCDDTAPREQTVHVDNTTLVQSAPFIKVTENLSGGDKPNMHSTLENKTLYIQSVHLPTNLTASDPPISVKASEILLTNFQSLVQQPTLEKRTDIKSDIQTSTCSSAESVTEGQSSEEYFNKTPSKKHSAPSFNHVLATTNPSIRMSSSVTHSSVDKLSSSNTRKQHSPSVPEHNHRNFNTPSHLQQISLPTTVSSTSVSPSVSHLSIDKLFSSNTRKQSEQNLLPSPSLQLYNSSFTQPSTSSNFQSTLNIRKEQLEEILKASNVQIDPIATAIQQLTVKTDDSFKRNVSEVYENSHFTADINCNKESVFPDMTQRAPKVQKVQDPRVPRRHIDIVFPHRKGSRDLELYQNIGRDFIERNNFHKLILQWNPEWLRIQNRSNVCPPIFDIETYKKHKGAKDFYRDKSDYYNTYAPLLFLGIWLNIFDNWKQGNCFMFSSTIRLLEKDKEFFKYDCHCEFENSDQAPEKESIILCQFQKGELFMCVTERHVDKKNDAKFRIFINSVEKLNVQAKEEVRFFVVFNCRLAVLQNKALQKLNPSMERMILNPSNHRQRLAYMKLQFGSNGSNLKQLRDDILNNAFQYQTTVTLLDILPSNPLDQQSYYIYYHNLIKFLAYKIWKEYNYKVLICMENKDAFEALVRDMRPYDPVLLVRGCEVQLKDDYAKYILEKRPDYVELNQKDPKAANDFISENYHIFITLLSTYKDDFFLLKRHKIACIMHNAHLCTEAHTALPLILKLDKLLMFGNQAEVPNIPVHLKNFGYNLSLYGRLLKGINI